MKFNEIINKSNFISSVINLAVRIISPSKNSVIKLEKSDKILIVSLHKLGDTVFTIPAIKILQKLYDDLTIVCFENSKTIYELVLKNIKYLIVNEADLKLGNRYLPKKYRNKLKEINPKIIFDITGNVLSASLIFSSKVKNIIGINENYFKSIYSKFISKRTTPHLIDLYLDVARAVHNISPEEIEKEYEASFNKNDKILNSSFCRLGG